MYGDTLPSFGVLQDGFPMGIFLNGNSKKIKKTIPVPINMNQLDIILDIVDDYPVYKIIERVFMTSNMIKAELYNEVGNNKRMVNNNILHMINKCWMKEIRAKGRTWVLAFGLIPYRIIKKYGEFYKIVILDVCDGYILTYKDLENRKTKYIWISDFGQDNTKEFKTETMSKTIRYDPDVFFYVVDGCSPNRNGFLQSILSSFVKSYIDLNRNCGIRTIQNIKRSKNPMIIEEEVPKNDDALKFMQRQREIEIQSVPNEDIRQSINPMKHNCVSNLRKRRIENTINASSQVSRQTDQSGIETTRIKFQIVNERVADQMSIGPCLKLLPGQRVRPNVIQKLEYDFQAEKFDFENKFLTALGTFFNIWDKETRSHAMSDAYLINIQRKSKNHAKSEVGIYEDFILEVYYRIYWKLHVDIMMTAMKMNTKNRKRKRETTTNNTGGQRGKSFGKETMDGYAGLSYKRRKIGRNTEKSTKTREFETTSKYLGDEGVEFLKDFWDLKVGIVSEPSIVRPGLEKLDEFFYAGKIDKDTYRSVYESIYPIPIMETSPAEMFEGKMKAQGMWIDQEYMEKSLKMMKTPDSLMAQQGQRQVQGGSSSKQPMKKSQDGQKDKLYQRRRVIK